MMMLIHEKHWHAPGSVNWVVWNLNQLEHSRWCGWGGRLQREAILGPGHLKRFLSKFCLELSSCWFSAWNVDTCGGWSSVGHMCSYDVQQLPICWNLSSPIYFKAPNMLKFKLANLYWPWVIYGKLLTDEYVYVANILYKLRHFLEERWMFFSLFFKALNMYISAMSPPPPWYFVALSFSDDSPLTLLCHPGKSQTSHAADFRPTEILLIPLKLFLNYLQNVYTFSTSTAKTHKGTKTHFLKLAQLRTEATLNLAKHIGWGNSLLFCLECGVFNQRICAFSKDEADRVSLI